VLRLLEVAQTDEEIGGVGAGPLEDFLHGHMESHFQEILAEEARNPKLRRALRGIYWPVDVPEEVVEQLKAASNEPQLEGEELRARAVEGVNREFERVAEILDVGLNALNASHPYSRYPNKEEAALAALAQAGAVLRFAEDLGLIDDYEYKSGQVVKRIFADHPDLRRMVFERITDR
jgi:hypothetical protein